MTVRRALLLLFLLLFVFSLTAVVASAEQAPEDYLTELFEGLPDAARDVLPGDPTDAAALGESVGIRHLAGAVLSALEGQAPALFRSFLSLCGITLFFALLTLIRENIGSGASRVADAALGLLLVITAYDRLLGTFTRASSYLGDLGRMAEVAAPVMGGLYLAGGNTASAMAGSGAMAALSLILEHLCASALLPLLRVMLGFLLVSAIGEVRTEGIVGTLKSLYTTVLGFFSMLVSASLTFGNALGTASDSLALRSVRFTVGSMIPMVGGTVSAGLSTLGAGVALIRATAGIGCVAAILLTCLPVAVELILARMLLSLLGSFSGLLGAGTAVKLYKGLRSLLDLTLAAVAFSSMLFILIAAIFARCAPAIG